MALTMKSFGAEYVVYEDSGFLTESVTRIYPLMDKVLFLVGMGPWNGDRDPITVAKTLATIQGIPDPDHKFTIICKWWATEEDQRNEGLQVLRSQGCDWCMTVDDDELYNREELHQAMEVISTWECTNGHVSAWLVSHLIYWKDRDTVIRELTPAMPVFLHTREHDAYFSQARCFGLRQGVYMVMPPHQLVMHHMSYVRSDEQMQRKMSSFSHASETASGWYDHIWRHWRPGMRNLHPNDSSPEAFSQAIPVSEVPWKMEPL